MSHFASPFALHIPEASWTVVYVALLLGALAGWVLGILAARHGPTALLAEQEAFERGLRAGRVLGLNEAADRIAGDARSRGFGR